MQGSSDPWPSRATSKAPNPTARVWAPKEVPAGLSVLAVSREVPSSKLSIPAVQRQEGFRI